MDLDKPRRTDEKNCCTSHSVVAVERKKLQKNCNMWAVLGNRIACKKRLLFRKNMKETDFVDAFVFVSSIGSISALSVVTFSISYLFSRFTEK